MSLMRKLDEATDELNLVRKHCDEIEQQLRAGEVVMFDDWILATHDLNIALDRVDMLLGRVPWTLWMLWFMGYSLLLWLMFVSVEESYGFGIVIPIIGLMVLTQHTVDFLIKMRLMRAQAEARLIERYDRG